jgi:hypothetical protein
MFERKKVLVIFGGKKMILKDLNQKIRTALFFKYKKKFYELRGSETQ